MLKQASVEQLRKLELTKNRGHIAVTMCFYPRGLKKELIDEYIHDLAPDRALFKDFKELQQIGGHETAFAASNYERRFTLGALALGQLERLAEMSRNRDVYLVCQCSLGQRCHRELLLLIAKNQYAAPADAVSHSYEVFSARMKASRPDAKKTASNPLGLRTFPND